MMIPDGWKLVPVEPTEEMVQAGALRGDDMTLNGYNRAKDNARISYRAMLVAAPLPPASTKGE